jgi:hypothetical protein
MQGERFTESEAAAKVGKIVRSLIAFCAVPKDTAGTVIGLVALAGGFSVIIEWDGSGTPFRDWFSKDEYERMLEEVE